MHWINWAIVIAYLVYVVVDGIRMSKDTDTLSGYFAANKSLSWWVVGLSVMATQLSRQLKLQQRQMSKTTRWD